MNLSNWFLILKKKTKISTLKNTVPFYLNPIVIESISLKYVENSHRKIYDMEYFLLLVLFLLMISFGSKRE
jgi:hypothetical protein